MCSDELWTHLSFYSLTLQEFEKIGEKHIKEYNDLLEEHQHILDEVKQLEQELRKEEIQ